MLSVGMVTGSTTYSPLPFAVAGGEELGSAPPERTAYDGDEELLLLIMPGGGGTMAADGLEKLAVAERGTCEFAWAYA